MQLCNDENLPKILVITVSAWDNNINLGNTLSNIFNGYPKGNIAHLYCRTELPNNNVCDIYYRIAESDIIKNVIHKSTQCGAILDAEDFRNANNKDVSRERKYYSVLRRNRFSLLLYAREILWKFARWKNGALDDFLQDFGPDVIYVNFPRVYYIYDIFTYIQHKTNARVLAFSDDDNYTLKQFSLSPYYWINRLGLRRKIRSLVEKADLVYCINKKQKQEYEEIFKREFKLLYKTGTFDGFANKRDTINHPIKLVYTGNIFADRWISLAKIGQALKTINKDRVKAQLYIYTRNAMSRKMLKLLDIKDSVFFMGEYPLEDFKSILLDADILVHAESFLLKSRLETRLSFSTKLVDYFESGRCIFAVGWSETAFIEYLAENYAAVIATSNDDIEYRLNELINNPQLILDYGQKAWECGKRNHQLDNIKKRFWADLMTLTETDVV